MDAKAAYKLVVERWKKAKPNGGIIDLEVAKAMAEAMVEVYNDKPTSLAEAGPQEERNAGE